MGAGIPGSKNGKPALPKFKKSSPIPAGVPMPKGPKAKNGTSLGMKSVKAGYDSNPGVTRADIISAAKMKTGKAKNGKVMKAQKGASVAPARGFTEKVVSPKTGPKTGAKTVIKKPIKKAQDGLKAVDLPEALVKAKSLKRGMMDIALGDDRKMSVDTTNYKNQRNLSRSYKDDPQTYNYTISDKSGKVLKKDRLNSEMYRDKQMIVDDMVKGLESGKLKRPAFKKGGKVLAKKPIKKAQAGDNIKNYDQEGSMLPEAVVTASRITDKPSKPSKPAKTKDWTRKVSRVNKAALKRSGAGAGKMTNILGMRKRYKEGGEVEMAKKGASVKKSMGKCKMGC